jgi:hypothetical protein
MSGGTRLGTTRGHHVATGELLIDLASVDRMAGVEKPTMSHKITAGVPANVVVGLARICFASALVGKVADDALGRYLCSVLELEGVRTDGLVVDVEADPDRVRWGGRGEGALVGERCGRDDLPRRRVREHRGGADDDRVRGGARAVAPCGGDRPGRGASTRGMRPSRSTTSSRPPGPQGAIVARPT